MNEKSELKFELFNRLDSMLSPYGFSSVFRTGRFQKKGEQGTAIFQLVCLDGKPGYRIQPNVGLRIENIERIFHLTSGFEPKFQKDTVTMGNSIGMFKSGDSRSCEFLLMSGSEIASVSDGIVAAFREFALPYYDYWGSLAAIDAELNDKPGQRTLHRSLPWFRCSTGIIVAKLTGRSDYDQLAAFYTEVMAIDNKGFYLHRFRSLLNTLETSDSKSQSH